ncbi:predicted protein [Streptomyces viridosporus ATCC 14672]|uniref:Predicted protein n=1 Tax=Streptomyces viridosporus (strain ATCC 14672 / DSM 40746 / JCM 4963 / KCTC 9882 / NRRL B-12104 / FH 1290) TaxID=566461 RepID=D6A8J9_STRV1|nr:predicted protein [Streptomyces viridosporus ATCC 14672]
MLTHHWRLRPCSLTRQRHCNSSIFEGLNDWPSKIEDSDRTGPPSPRYHRRFRES